MVKERPEEARNSPKGNFYFFLPLLYFFLPLLWGELWKALALFYFYFLLFFSLVLLKFQNNV
ncbi:hypothetical protein [Helicobacter pylori]|uniref:hypothetical protein n=1 Tax=Helicobacter pylori TaxID=210 RepID=UPI001128BC74|nr:hypothetical protein [Helicobacter pylori]TPH84695.1 hypothetical protein FIM50_01260 [Helicobacter pylori]TPH93106.1 hypothetical protein FIM44_01285 [Helicobacter pylori]TPI06013.1 hypothetical protein FIM35_04565 [Helicobacter pylori]